MGLLLDLVEDLAADVVVGVQADLLAERRELAQRAEGLDLLAPARVQVDAHVAEGARRAAPPRAAPRCRRTTSPPTPRPRRGRARRRPHRPGGPSPAAAAPRRALATGAERGATALLEVLGTVRPGGRLATGHGSPPGSRRPAVTRTPELQSRDATARAARRRGTRASPGRRRGRRPRGRPGPRGQGQERAGPGHVRTPGSLVRAGALRARTSGSGGPSATPTRYISQPASREPTTRAASVTTS